MLTALGQILPIGVAAALSTVPIMAVIMVLLSPRRTSSAVPFAVGWAIGLALVSTSALLLGRSLPPVKSHDSDAAVGVAEIVIGTALLVLAVVTLVRPSTGRSTSTGRKGWLDTVGSLRPLACLGLALALNFRPKGLLLGFAAGLAVATEARGPVADAVVLAIYLVIASSTVVVPVVLTILAPARMQPLLEAVRDWLTANRKVVSDLIVFLIGLVVLGAGLANL